MAAIAANCSPIVNIGTPGGAARFLVGHGLVTIGFISVALNARIRLQPWPY